MAAWAAWSQRFGRRTPGAAVVLRRCRVDGGVCERSRTARSTGRLLFEAISWGAHRQLAAGSGTPRRSGACNDGHAGVGSHIAAGAHRTEAPSRAPRQRHAPPTMNTTPLGLRAPVAEPNRSHRHWLLRRAEIGNLSSARGPRCPRGPPRPQRHVERLLQSDDGGEVRPGLAAQHVVQGASSDPCFSGDCGLGPPSQRRGQSPADLRGPVHRRRRRRDLRPVGPHTRSQVRPRPPRAGSLTTIRHAPNVEPAQSTLGQPGSTTQRLGTGRRRRLGVRNLALSSSKVRRSDQRAPVACGVLAAGDRCERRRRSAQR